jgi:hypothetical protein
MESHTLTNTHELLAQQLQTAEAEGQPVQAWFRLKAKGVQKAAPSPEQTDALAQKIVDRAKTASGKSVNALTVQPYLGTFTVLAHPALVKEIMSQPEVETGGATHVPGVELIRPVESKPVKLPLQHKKRRAKQRRLLR